MDRLGARIPLGFPDFLQLPVRFPGVLEGLDGSRKSQGVCANQVLLCEGPEALCTNQSREFYKKSLARMHPALSIRNHSIRNSGSTPEFLKHPWTSLDLLRSFLDTNNKRPE